MKNNCTPSSQKDKMRKREQAISPNSMSAHLTKHFRLHIPRESLLTLFRTDLLDSSYPGTSSNLTQRINIKYTTSIYASKENMPSIKTHQDKQREIITAER